MASHSNKGHWVFADECLKAHRAARELHAGPNTVKVHDVRGVGCVITPPYLGIDIDDCRNAESGELSAFAQEFLAKFPATFTEISMSGTGLHLWYHCADLKLEKGTKTKLGEVYQHSRYLWMTGNLLGGTPNEIERVAPSQVKEMISLIVERSKKETAILDARKEPSRTTEDQKFAMLERGEWESLQIGDKSHSAARWYFLVLLAKRYNFDAQVVDQKFRASGMYRGDKERLLDSEVAGAIEAARRGASPVTAHESRSLILPDACMTQRQPQRWFWKPVMHRGGMLNLSGESSQGKSPLTVDLAARLSRFPGASSRGEAVWPDGQPIPNAPLSTIMLNNEDNLEDTILPRFDLAGGYEMFFHPVTGVHVEKSDSHHQRMLGLKEDLDLICGLARKLAPHLGMVIIDPITNYLGQKIKMNAEEDVRSVLMPLVGLAQELGITVVTVSHLNKAESQDPMSRVMGARAFIGVPRDAWQCADDPDSENKYAHILGPVRGPKASQSLRYHTEVVNVEIGDEMSDVIHIVWDGKSNATIEQGLDQDAKKNLSQEKAAAVELKNFLNSGKQSAAACQSFLRESGFDVEKMNFGRVRKYAGVLHKQEGGGENTKSMWYLPTHADLFEPPPARVNRLEEMKKNDPPEY